MAQQLAPIQRITDAVISCDKSAIVSAARAAIQAGADPIKAIKLGLMPGLAEIEKRFEERRLPSLRLVSAEYAVREARDLLISSLPESQRPPPAGRVVLGIAQGDPHSIGKMISKAMLCSRGFEVFDLGEDVKAEEFVKRAEELNADVIAVGTLMLQCMITQKQVVEILDNKGLRDSHKVVIGGRPEIVTQEYAEEIGADACGFNISDFANKIAKSTAANRSGSY